MDQIVTYAERQLSPFSQQDFSPVDSLILSWISYLHLPEAQGWEGIPLAGLFRAEHFPRMFQDVWDTENSRRLFTAMAASPRFRESRVMGYTELLDAGQVEQFAAVTFQLDGERCYVAFRGTNATLVGWKEDFNMAFQYPIPSQAEAARYLETAAAHCKGELRLGGHSKGGNLAVYAAANCSGPVKERIARIYSHDGPGFLASVLESEEFRSVSDRIDKTLPQSSVVGMLLEQQEAFRIVRSNKVSFWQHDPFSWEVAGDDFCYIDQLTPDAIYLNHTLNGWVGAMSPQERERFIDALFSLIGAENADADATFAQLRAGGQTSLPAIAQGMAQMDPATRDFLLQTVRELAALSIRNFPEIFRRG